MVDTLTIVTVIDYSIVLWIPRSTNEHITELFLVLLGRTPSVQTYLSHIVALNT